MTDIVWSIFANVVDGDDSTHDFEMDDQMLRLVVYRWEKNNPFKNNFDIIVKKFYWRKHPSYGGPTNLETISKGVDFDFVLSKLTKLASEDVYCEHVL